MQMPKVTPQWFIPAQNALNTLACPIPTISGYIQNLEGKKVGIDGLPMKIEKMFILTSTGARKIYRTDKSVRESRRIEEPVIRPDRLVYEKGRWDKYFIQRIVLGNGSIERIGQLISFSSPKRIFVLPKNGVCRINSDGSLTFAEDA